MALIQGHGITAISPTKTRSEAATAAPAPAARAAAAAAAARRCKPAAAATGLCATKSSCRSIRRRLIMPQEGKTITAMRACELRPAVIRVRGTHLRIRAKVGTASQNIAVKTHAATMIVIRLLATPKAFWTEGRKPFLPLLPANVTDMTLLLPHNYFYRITSPFVPLGRRHRVATAIRHRAATAAMMTAVMTAARPEAAAATAIGNRGAGKPAKVLRRRTGRRQGTAKGFA